MNKPEGGDGPAPSGSRRSADSPVLLAGPTAVGKSSIALHLAKALGGEIISVDSMQVYRGLDIGTAKPLPEERRRVPHHLIDILELDQSFDAAQFVELAQKAVEDIQARGRLPILCGGTGFYFKALLEGLDPTPPVDPALRAALKATPLPDLLRELEQSDPAAFARIARQDLRRVVRALEVIRLTGQPFSAQRAPRQGAGRPLDWGSHFFCFSRSSTDLRARIDARVDEMFHRGLVAETERLLARGLEKNETAQQALGYRQVVEHLRGERPLAETIELVKIRTRQFAKRQLTWFRHQAKVQWIHLDESDPRQILPYLLQQLKLDRNP
ncbi:MAG: tRNA (adenosine(37)-N6)-dimethylallyltransferase MiaA [Verrucomicrobia bacterium]|nr:tRNA (adenosine(37)-N6)-dimethylallyltransferase MiaA [Verrucomicrobiota bacterium]